MTRRETYRHGMYQKHSDMLWWWQYYTCQRTTWYLFGIPVFFWTHTYEDRPFHEIFHGRRD